MRETSNSRKQDLKEKESTLIGRNGSRTKENKNNIWTY